jgi:hypothetical protein
VTFTALASRLTPSTSFERALSLNETSLAASLHNLDRIGALRGFLPSGLSNACPHAPTRVCASADMGRRRTNLKKRAAYIGPVFRGGPAIRMTLPGSGERSLLADSTRPRSSSKLPVEISTFTLRDIRRSVLLR